MGMLEVDPMIREDLHLYQFLCQEPLILNSKLTIPYIQPPHARSSGQSQRPALFPSRDGWGSGQLSRLFSHYPPSTSLRCRNRRIPLFRHAVRFEDLPQLSQRSHASIRSTDISQSLFAPPTSYPNPLGCTSSYILRGFHSS